MLKRNAIWACLLSLVPVCCRAGQAVPAAIPQHPWIAAVQRNVWRPADNQVHSVTGMRRSPLNTDSKNGWILSEGAEISKGYDSNPLTYVSSPDDNFTRFSGNLGFTRSRTTGALDLSYSGGALLYHRLDTFNQSFHRAKLEKTFLSPRWSVLGSAEFKYLPDYPLFVFGAGDGGSGLPPGGGANDLVLVGNNQPFYSSGAMMEASHSLTPRSSITGAFRYGMLRFVNNGYVGNSSYYYSAGYNHQLTRSSILGLRYTDKRFDFQNTPVNVDSRSPAVVLEHRVLNRFLGYFAAGPEMYSISGAPHPALTHWTWALDAGLEYSIHNSTFSANYSHGTSSGSGVLVGSELHAATARVEERISDHWSTSAETSWSRGVAVTPGPTELSNLTVLMGGGQITRRVFAGESMFLRFTYANENRPPSCAQVSCAIGLNRAVVELGIKLSHSSAHEIRQEGK